MDRPPAKTALSWRAGFFFNSLFLFFFFFFLVHEWQPRATRKYHFIQMIRRFFHVLALSLSLSLPTMEHWSVHSVLLDLAELLLDPAPATLPDVFYDFTFTPSAGLHPAASTTKATFVCGDNGVAIGKRRAFRQGSIPSAARRPVIEDAPRATLSRARNGLEETRPTATTASFHLQKQRAQLRTRPTGSCHPSRLTSPNSQSEQLNKKNIPTAAPRATVPKCSSRINSVN